MQRIIKGRQLRLKATGIWSPQIKLMCRKEKMYFSFDEKSALLQQLPAQKTGDNALRAATELFVNNLMARPSFTSLKSRLIKAVKFSVCFLREKYLEMREQMTANAVILALHAQKCCPVFSSTAGRVMGCGHQEQRQASFQFTSIPLFYKASPSKMDSRLGTEAPRLTS